MVILVMLKLFGLVFAINILGCHGKKFKGNVVGGQYVKIQETPHAVYVHCGTENWFCGGTVLNQRMVLTAGHCFSDVKPDASVMVFAGHENLNKVNVTRKVISFTRHENYDFHKLVADIALLYLNNDLPLSERIQRVIIRPNFPQGEIYGKVAGWGYVNEMSRQKTMMLKMVKQKVWPMSKCNEYVKMFPGTICASSGKATAYPFVGDSGSALVTNEGQAVGLVSYRANDTKLELSVFTNVSSYYHWIEAYAEKLSCCQ